MMTKEQAAQYFIVAWVKGWSLMTYFKVITEGKLQMDEVSAYYPWMPPLGLCLWHKVTVRRYLACFKKENDRLFDCSTNAERLALAPMVQTLDGRKADMRHPKFIKDVCRVGKRERAKYRLTEINEAKSVDKMRRAAGHSWGVVK